jgi:hypothetical protein
MKKIYLVLLFMILGSFLFSCKVNFDNYCYDNAPYEFSDIRNSNVIYVEYNENNNHTSSIKLQYSMFFREANYQTPPKVNTVLTVAFFERKFNASEIVIPLDMTVVKNEKIDNFSTDAKYKYPLEENEKLTNKNSSIAPNKNSLTLNTSHIKGDKIEIVIALYMEFAGGSLNFSICKLLYVKSTKVLTPTLLYIDPLRFLDVVNYVSTK